ncbi:ATP-dependent helicase [Paenibacillus sp. 843]|uniref:ATP-dependent helicase n=1 Tax=Paenibacillus sp. 843 TaxID=3341795 RepID=UPI0037294437
MSFDELLQNFNKEQRYSITAPEGHLVINAAAGTGKTSTLAARILYLQLELDVPPSSIIAISFSRTARARLTEKLAQLIKQVGAGSLIPVYTFHGLAYRIIRIATGNQETWLKPNFEVLVPSSAPNFEGSNEIFIQYEDFLFNNIRANLDKEILSKSFTKVIDQLRQGADEMEALLEPEDLPRGYELQCDIDQSTTINVITDDVITVWKRYSELLKRNNKIDYNGLITEAIRILQHTNHRTLDRVRDGLKYILVDEYQDTSRAQEQLLSKLVSSTNISINAVGDINQTIYTFNGSSISNLRDFYTRMGDTSTKTLQPIVLSENYRSSKAILDVANRIIRKDSQIKLVPASGVLPEPLNKYRDQNYPVQIIHATTLELAADFVANEISKLTKDGDISPNEIAVLVRKNSEFAPQSDKVKEYLDKYNIEYIASTNIMEKENKNNQMRCVFDFCQEPENYVELIDVIIDRINNKEVEVPEEATSELLIMYLNEALNAGAQYCYEAGDLLYDNINADPEPDELNGSVQIRTVHSAKGEEFRVVFLMYLGDRSFPHSSKPDLEEERRLLYVGITRAQEKLYIIGRPGIKFDDYLNECKGGNTKFNEYFSFNKEMGQNSKNIIEISKKDLGLIEQARLIQKEEERKYRQEIEAWFEEE